MGMKGAVCPDHGAGPGDWLAQGEVHGVVAEGWGAVMRLTLEHLFDVPDVLRGVLFNVYASACLLNVGRLSPWWSWALSK